MPAIGAIFYRDQRPVEQVQLERMARAMALHGPEKQVMQCHGSLGLVWCKRSGFTPEDRLEKQPVTSINERWLCVFAGELQHRDDLARALSLSNRERDQTPDSTLFTAAISKFGLKGVNRVYGDFSVILFDRKNQRLTALLSQFHGQPLHYHDDGKRLVVATSIAGILALGDIPKEIDETKVADSLMLNYDDWNRTFYKGIHKLTSARWLEASRARTEVKQYYDFMNVPDVRLATDDDYVAQADALLKQAVADAMRAPVTPACSMSGGLDSSTVSVYALPHAQAKGEQLMTLTSVPESGYDGIVHKGRFGDEGPRARELAAMYPDMDHHCFDSQGLGLYDFSEAAWLHCDAPFCNAMNLHWIHDMHQRVAKAGKSVIVGGASGNASLTQEARQYPAELLRQGRLGELLAECWANRKKESFGGLRMLSRALMPFLPAAIFRWYMETIRKRGGIGWAHFSLANPDYFATHNTEQRAFDCGFDPWFQPLRTRREFMAALLHPDRSAEGPAVMKMMESLHGVRMRDPLGDRKLVEWCVGIPTNQYRRQGQDRYLIHRMMKGRLPPIYFSQGRGRQAADWHLRMTRNLPRLRADLEALKKDPAMAQRIDLSRMHWLLNNWPDKTPDPNDAKSHYAHYCYGLNRAVETARFINWAEGKNR